MLRKRKTQKTQKPGKRSTMSAFILCLFLCVSIIYASCTTNYFDNDFSLDFEAEVGVDSQASAPVPIGSIANLNKNVNLTVEVTEDPNCPSYGSGVESLYIYWHDSPYGMSNTIWTIKSTKFSNVTVFPKLSSSYLTSKFFSARSYVCNFSVKAKTVSYD
jgi:hypothetical protein